MFSTNTRMHARFLAVGTLVLGLGASAPQALATNDVILLDEAEIFFEENATDGDLGIQFFLDGEAWERMTLVTPDWRRLIDIKVKGSAAVIGLTEIFSESNEPSFDELPREDFIALFPPGNYIFFGRTVERDWVAGLATLTHDMPAQPVIVSPAEDSEIDPDAPLSVEWNLVPDPNPAESAIEAYQVVVEKDEEDERLRVFSVDMRSTDTSVTVPAEFFEPGKAYKVEIIVEETSGNKTISEREFETED